MGSAGSRLLYCIQIEPDILTKTSEPLSVFSEVRYYMPMFVLELSIDKRHEKCKSSTGGTVEQLL